MAKFLALVVRYIAELRMIGNGKTISLKAVMKSVQEDGHYPLYVRTFKSKMFALCLRM